MSNVLERFQAAEAAYQKALAKQEAYAGQLKELREEAKELLGEDPTLEKLKALEASLGEDIEALEASIGELVEQIEAAL